MKTNNIHISNRNQWCQPFYNIGGLGYVMFNHE